MGHTKGLWSIGDENNQCCEVLIGTEYNLVASLDRQDGNTGKFVISREEMLANARRIVECVNALSGIENPAEFVAKAKKDAEELEALQERVKQLESDKARLLEALKKSNKHLNSHPAFSASSTYKSNKQLITEMEG
jgi:cell shape-determining protein MreC